MQSTSARALATNRNVLRITAKSGYISLNPVQSSTLISEPVVGFVSLLPELRCGEESWAAGPVVDVHRHDRSALLH